MQKSSSYVFIILLGYALKRAGVLGRQDYRVLSQVVLCVTLPAAVVTNFASMQWDMSLLAIPLVGLLLNCLMLFAGQLVSRKKDPAARALFMINCPGYNIGAFALPFVQSFLGPTAVVAACLFDVGNAIVCTGGSYAYTSALLRVGGEQPGVKAVLKKLAGSVPFMTYIIMLGLVMAGVRLPGALTQFISPIAAANPFVAMFMVGAMFELEPKPEYLRQMGQVLALRLAAAAAAALALYHFAPFSLEIRQVLAVMAFAPASVISPAFTEKCGGSGPLAGCLNSATILLGVVGMLGVLLALGVA